MKVLTFTPTAEQRQELEQLRLETVSHEIDEAIKHEELRNRQAQIYRQKRMTRLDNIIVEAFREIGMSAPKLGKFRKATPVKRRNGVHLTTPIAVLVTR